MKTFMSVVLTLVFVGGSHAYAADGREERSSPQSLISASHRSVAVLSPLEVYTAERSFDWFHTAERIVVLRVTSESEFPAQRDGTPKGFDLSGRRIEAEVERTLWSAKESSGEVLPDHLEMRTPGWLTNGDGRRLTVSADLSSRLEVGHRYVVGLSQRSLDCSADLPASRRWSRFASGAAIPFDTDVLGIGEFEGQIVTRPFGGIELLSESFRTVAGRSLDEMIPLMQGQAARQKPRPQVDLPSCEALPIRD